MHQNADQIFSVELTVGEIAAIEAGLRLLKHFNVGGSSRTCIVTDTSGTASHTQMDAIDDVANGAGKALSRREIDALIRKIVHV